MPFSALPFAILPVAILPVIDEGSDGGPVVVTHQAFAVCSDVSEPKLFWRLRACRHHHANPAFHNFPQVQAVLSRVDSDLAEKVVRDFHRGLHVLHFSRKYGFMQICRQGFASPQAIELQTQARTGTNWLVRGATSSSGSAVDWARREFLGDGFGAFDGMVAAHWRTCFCHTWRGASSWALRDRSPEPSWLALSGQRRSPERPDNLGRRCDHVSGAYFKCRLTFSSLTD